MLERLLKPTNKKRVLFFILFDILISTATIALAYLLRFNFDIPLDFFNGMVIMMVLLIPIKIALFYFNRLYFIAWRYFGLVEYSKIIVAHFILYIPLSLLSVVFGEYFNHFPRSVILIDMFLSLFFIGLLRISRRLYLERQKEEGFKPTLIIGANDRANYIIKSSSNGEIDYQPLALISDKKNLVGTYFSNLKVYNQEKLEDVIKEYETTAVIIADELSQEELDRLYGRLKSVGILEIKIANILQDNKPTLKDISIEDLLARKPKDLDMLSIANFISGKIILITGAGGSIGSELSRQVALFGAKHIVLLDHSEFNLYAISEELKEYNITSSMVTVKDRDALEEIFALHSIDVVLHAAAYKHVPLCEENIESAVQNNIFGTKNVIDLAVSYGVDKFVLISTDKAVRPTNVMGTTKRICEIYAHAIPSKETEIVAVRFGNVLGSSGSVIPKFRSQIEQGKNITVTHPDITRYFMMIPEACQLVLQSASIAKGGELFILDMGEPIKIVDLAKKMIELSGRDDIKIEFTGLRAGEKLYEELLIDDADLKTEYDSIMVTKNEVMPYSELLDKLDRFKEGHYLEILKDIVPEFNHNI